jgi:hypothetical protein
MALPLGLKVMLLNYAVTLALLPWLYLVLTELCVTNTHVSYPVDYKRSHDCNSNCVYVVNSLIVKMTELCSSLMYDGNAYSFGSSDSSVGIETRLWAGRSNVHVPASGRKFSLLNKFQTDSEAHQTALFKDPVRTALLTIFISVIKINQFML